MINETTVEACYRALLGRPPESAAVVERAIREAGDLEGLLRGFVASPEFADRMRREGGEEARAGRPAIDVDVTDAQRAALFEAVRRQWRTLGETEPFWSVLTHDEYRAANLDAAAKARFYATGAEHAGLIDLFCARTATPPPRGTCLELGCGVGRMTKHLAGAFQRVIAADVSEGNLRECRAMAAEAGLANIEFVLLRSPEDIAQVKRFDVFVSVITLQHNQPPVQKHLLDQILRRLSPGGVFLFQAQTYYPGYAFDIEAYLAAPPDTMEMHSLPMCEIMRLIDRRGALALEVLEDDWTGRQGSHTFFGTKRARRGWFGGAAGG
jgi:2-polyprenyl-3-methyl-5-hydroxy-6-metoxy-1,4-benzoquinol methylase